MDIVIEARSLFYKRLSEIIKPGNDEDLSFEIFIEGPHFDKVIKATILYQDEIIYTKVSRINYTKNFDFSRVEAAVFLMKTLTDKFNITKQGEIE